MLGRGQKWYIMIHFMVIKPRHALFCQGLAGCCVFCAIPDSPGNTVGAGLLTRPPMFGMVLFHAEGFALRGEFLFSRRKRNQNAAGGGLRWASPPIVAPPPDPSASRISYPSLRPEGQSSLIPSLRLSNANPLRWALRWEPPAAAKRRLPGNYLRNRAAAAVGPKLRRAAALDQTGAPDRSGPDRCGGNPAGGGSPPLPGNFGHVKYDGNSSQETAPVFPEADGTVQTP